MNKAIYKLLPFLIIAIVVSYFLSLHYGWWDPFFFDGQHAHNRGVDFFALPKTFLNLLESRSMYDTWGGTPYGPHATWYLAHPVYAVLVCGWFSLFTPMKSYWLFTLLSAALLAIAGYFISKENRVNVNKTWAYLILLCSFPAYTLFYTGNMHAATVLALTLIFISIMKMTYAESDLERTSARKILMAGLLLSFFTKPIVLLMLPLLLFTKETRSTTLKSLGIYIVVSVIFISVPFLNPEGIGWSKIFYLAENTDIVQSEMNIYKNNFRVTDLMKDNSMHWFNLIAQSDYKLNHIDNYSLPVFMDTVLGRIIPAGVYKIPIYIILLLSCFVAFIKDVRLKMEVMLLLLFAISTNCFLGSRPITVLAPNSLMHILLSPVCDAKSSTARSSIKKFNCFGKKKSKSNSWNLISCMLLKFDQY